MCSTRGSQNADTPKGGDDKVFQRTCWHCHSEPDYAIGDGGPGNSGGFGLRGLNPPYVKMPHAFSNTMNA